VVRHIDDFRNIVAERNDNLLIGRAIAARECPAHQRVLQLVTSEAERRIFELFQQFW